VNIGKSVEQAVIREMKEEISLDITIQFLLGVYSNPKRDIRFHAASVIYLYKVS